jgi:DsbC/DsbD-like thiol-disulfide interchange protein
VVAKFFHDSYKKRDSPESLIDAALGRVQFPDEAPSASRGDDDVRITVAVQGGKGTLRQGILRNLIVRFELAEGLHIYGEPVPEGMVATSIVVKPQDGLEVQETIRPATRPLRLTQAGVELQVWSGTVDFVVPFYPTGEMASEVRPLDVASTCLEVSVRYQACDDQNCLLPRTEEFSIEVPLDVIDVPAVRIHMGHGQREAKFDGMPHVRRLLLRKVRRNPLGMLRFIGKTLKLELAALRRRRSA